MFMETIEEWNQLKIALLIVELCYNVFYLVVIELCVGEIKGKSVL